MHPQTKAPSPSGRKKRACRALRLALILMPCMAALAFPACSSGKGPKKLVVWSYSNEIKQMIDLHALRGGVDPEKLEVDFVATAPDFYQSKLDPALKGGKDAPDIFVVEAAWVRKYVESGYGMDLSPLRDSWQETIPYVLQMGTDRRGKVLALSWQASPGAYFYRRSLARKYLGTDDPARVQTMLADFDKLMDTAEKLKKASRGKAVLVSAPDSLFEIYKAGRDSAWVEEGRLVIDPLMVRQLDDAKALAEGGMEGGKEQFQLGWYSGMKGEPTWNGDRELEVLGYFFPTWGYWGILKPNSRAGSQDTSGDWAMTQGPEPWFSGGAWLMIRQGSKVRKEALELLRSLCGSDAFLSAWAEEEGDFVSSLPVMEKLHSGARDPFLGGQNPWESFLRIAQYASASHMGPWDQELDALWMEAWRRHVRRGQSRDEAIAAFRESVSARFPEIRVD